MSYVLDLKPRYYEPPNWKQLAFSNLDAQWANLPDPITIMQQDRVVAELFEVYPDFEVFSRSI